MINSTGIASYVFPSTVTVLHSASPQTEQHWLFPLAAESHHSIGTPPIQIRFDSRGSSYWNEDRRVALLCALVLVIALWAIAGQLYFLAELSPPPALVDFLAGLAHPVRVMYAVLMLLVVPTVLIPTYLVVKSERALRFVRELTNRLGLLIMVYLLMDALALIVILFRNLRLSI